MRVSPTFSLICLYLSSLCVTSAERIIHKDVAIVGGGAAGVWAATLLEQMGKSFVVVEKEAHFGGHTETYTIPGTDTTLDYGVQGYSPLVDGSYDVIERFFGAYDVPISYIHRTETSGGTARYFDFRTYQELKNFTYSTDLSSYTTQVDKYPYLNFQVQTPSPIPSDLTLSFGDFVKKYSLQSSVFDIYYQAEGLGDTLSLPAYYVLREMNAAHLLALQPSSPGLLVTTAGDNQEPYIKAQAKFGTDALVGSTVQSAHRNESGVELTVNTPSGPLIVRTPKLLVTIPPTTSNMEPFDLDNSESNLFSKFAYSGWYVALVNITGLPVNASFQNAGTDTLYNLPQLPAVYQITTTKVSGIYLVRYGSAGYMSTNDVRADMVSSVEKIRAAVTPNAGYLAAPDILAFGNHLPYTLHVTSADLAAGFDNQLWGLQGHRSTWYSGATFTGSSSTDVWNATEAIVASMLAV